MDYGTIRCRCGASKACTHGKAAIMEYGDPDADMRDDGTYMRSDNSVVCTACYIAIGMPLNPVLPHKTADNR
jgi:hypothetical protein